MIRAYSQAAALVTMLVALAACGDGSTAPANPQVMGEWVGQVIDGRSVGNFTFRLSEAETSAVTGTASLQVESLTYSGTVSGLHTYPSVSLTIQFTLFGEVATSTYQGQLVTEDSMRGSWQPSDDPAHPLDLDRVVR